MILKYHAKQSYFCITLNLENLSSSGSDQHLNRHRNWNFHYFQELIILRRGTGFSSTLSISKLDPSLLNTSPSCTLSAGKSPLPFNMKSNPISASWVILKQTNRFFSLPSKNIQLDIINSWIPYLKWTLAAPNDFRNDILWPIVITIIVPSQDWFWKAKTSF